jgi:hypothetical protein
MTLVCVLFPKYTTPFLRMYNTRKYHSVGCKEGEEEEEVEVQTTHL